MGQVHDTIRTVNSTLRTLLFGALLVGAGLVGWKGYSFYNEPQQKLAVKQQELDSARSKLVQREQELATRMEELAKLETEFQVQVEQIDRLETSMRLLKLSHRIARLHVVDQQENAESGRIETTVKFFEVNDEGAPIDDRRRQFKVEGDRIYVECLVAKFEDKYVEHSDLDRSTAICLFQRIFGEYQQPQEGFELDKIGSSPTSYARGGQMSDFEQQIWGDFWNIANNQKKAAELGIRAAHADAPSTRVRKGKTYELELRSTGEFTLKPVESSGR
jgi:hypothetical protein